MAYSQNTINAKSLIQISIEPGADINFLKNQIELSPIELIVQQIGDYNLTVTFNKPTGIQISKISLKSDEYLDTVDIETNEYNKLIIPRFPRSGVLLSINEITIEDILNLERRPIYIKAHRDNAIFIACTDKWEVLRSELSKDIYAYDATVVPSQLLNMLKILDEPNPKSLLDVKGLIERVNLRIQAFKWYDTRVLTRQIHESIHFHIIELESKNIELRDYLIDDDTLGSDDTIYLKILIQELSKHLPETLIDQAKTQAVKLQELQLNENGGLNEVEIRKLLLPFSENSNLANVVNSLLCPELEDIPILNCKLCNSPPFLKQKRKTLTDGTKVPLNYEYVCKSCVNGHANLQPHKLRSAALTMWNLANLNSDVTMPNIALLVSGAKNQKEIRDWVRDGQRLLRSAKSFRQECKLGNHGLVGKTLAHRLYWYESWVHYLFKSKLEIITS